MLDSQIPEIRYLPDSKFAKFIIDKCDVLKERFKPTFWASSSLAQTIVPVIYRNRLPHLNYTREILNCSDGGIVAIDWLNNSKMPEDNESKPIALMFPGLAGDSQSDYLRHIALELQNQGYRVAALNNRGRGGLELKSPRLYCATYLEDYKLAIGVIRKRNPTTRIVATGFSMGAMLLTRYLAEQGDKSEINAAMLVSGNYDLVNGTKNMESSWTLRFAGKIMSRHLAKIILSEKDMLSRANKPVKWDKIESATSFRELDEYFTCPMWGYATAEDYFKDATNNERMPNIKVPTICLNSADDMFSPYESKLSVTLYFETVFTITDKKNLSPQP